MEPLNMNVASLVAMFQCTTQEASQVLDTCGNNLEEAAALYLAMKADGYGAGGARSEAQPGPTANAHNQQSFQESDLEMAQRLEREDAMRAAAVNDNDTMDDDAVRAALPQTYDTLYGDPHAAARTMPRWNASNQQNQASASFGTANWDDQTVGGTAATRSSARIAAANAAADPTTEPNNSASALAKLFEPPVAIMYKGTGGFQGAKQHALELDRFLIVNIQSGDEFASHALNRDVWADEVVQSAISSSFVFYQVAYDTDEGARLYASYRCTTLPTVFGVDPLTGMACSFMWTPSPEAGLASMPTPERMLALLEPLMLHKGPKSGEVPPSIAGNSAANRIASAASAAQPSVVDMDEDAQLAAAIAASMEGQPAAAADRIASAASVAQAEAPRVDEEPAAPKLPEVPDEPAADAVSPSGAKVARILVRTPGGGRKERRFFADARVGELYAWVSSLPADEKVPESFRLVTSYPRKVIDATVLDSTLAEAMGDSVSGGQMALFIEHS
ncbi:UBX domain-containing protein [Pseudoscourfieldia marina]